MPGGELTYTLEVSNAGPVPVTGATVTDDVPATLGDVTWTCTGVGAAVCGSASGSGDVSVGVDIPVDGSVVVTVTGTVASDATDPIVNTATVTPPDTISDPTPENNSATDTDAPGIADLELVKAVEGESFLTGEPVTYTIDVTNHGPAVATAPVTVTDPLPESVTFDSASGQGWSCAADAGTVVCTFDGDLAVDDSTSFQIVGILTAEPSEAVVNTATVSAGNAEATLSNNESSAELIVDPVEVEPVVIQAPPPPPAPTPPQPQVLARVQPQTVLVRTGTSVALYLGGATLLVLCGLWVRRVGRRRPSE